MAKRRSELEIGASFMARTLARERRELTGVPLMVSDGEGGERENPRYAAYEKLFREYRLTMRDLESRTAEEPAGSSLIDMRKSLGASNAG